MQPFDLGRRFLPGGNHFGRALHADDGGVRPSLLDQFGDVACPGPEIGDGPYRKIGNPHQKVDRRP